MGSYLVKRLAASLLTAILSSIAVFLIVRAVPGDVVAQMLGQSGGSGSQAEEALRRFFGLNEPLYVQYLDWLGGVLRGDLGQSWVRGQPVMEIVFKAFTVTLQLGLMTLAFATIIGVPLGLVSGLFEGRRIDTAIQAFNILGLSAPVFWLGLILLIAVSSLFAWSPPLIYRTPFQNLSDNLSTLLLPMLSLGLLQAAAYSQFTRQCVVGAFSEDYVRTALAKGLPMRVVFAKHILRNIMISLVTFMGLILIQILGGVVVIESLFALPGLGRLLITAIETRDYPVVQGALLMVVFSALLVNLLVDMLYHVIDPRVRVDA
ncbi:ABC transporter permease [Actibacterium sp. MT2.3-13A]|uniref:ABC transporter permease n=1 Tax=Actibacterium sp. MT2.3-13A TaxID=2828332 RepID=UPI001BA604D8|nr:ABC transporter permease [Actibacterium sp. MT2.3-13A]